MADVIQGPVTQVVDGDTFDMTVTYANPTNKIRYNHSERIRIASIDAPELNTPAGKRSKDALERKLKGKWVSCTVQARDTYSRIVADVKLI